MRAAATILVLLAMPAPPARACSHPSIPGAPFLVVPADGETEVPTNVVISLARAMYPNGPAMPPWQILDDAGAAQPLSATETVTWGSGDLPTTTVRLTPAAALAAGSHYRVAQVDGDVVLYAGEFTTGSGPDAGVPAAPVLESLAVGAGHSCQSRLLCCGSEPRVIDVSIAVAAPAEPVTYTLREGATVLAEDTSAPLAGLLVCGPYSPAFRLTPLPDLPSEWLATAGPHELTLVARDVAGNESPPLAIFVDGDCANDDEGTGELPPGGGGGCAAGGRPSLAAGLALLLVMLWRRAWRG